MLPSIRPQHLHRQAWWTAPERKGGTSSSSDARGIVKCIVLAGSTKIAPKIAQEDDIGCSDNMIIIEGTVAFRRLVYGKAHALCVNVPLINAKALWCDCPVHVQTLPLLFIERRPLTHSVSASSTMNMPQLRRLAALCSMKSSSSRPGFALCRWAGVVEIAYAFLTRTVATRAL